MHHIFVITLNTHKVLIQTSWHCELATFGILSLCTDNKLLGSQLNDLAMVSS